MAGGSWKVAYSDFVTALMAFFLLMWILAMVPEEKRAEMAVYFMDPGGYQSNATIIDHNSPPPLGSPDDETSQRERENLAIYRFLNQMLAELMAEDKAKSRPTEAGVLLRTSNALTFPADSATLGPEGDQILNAVVEVMRRFKVHLMISGHTDSAESGGAQFGDKWTLSAARAAAVTAYIVEKGGINPSLIMSASYANYKPIVPDSKQDPNPVNRRVEFFFYSPDTRPANLGFDNAVR